MQFIPRLSPICRYASCTNGISSSIIQVFTIRLPVTGLINPAAAFDGVWGLGSSITICATPACSRYQLSQVPQMPCPMMSMVVCILSLGKLIAEYTALSPQLLSDADFENYSNILKMKQL